VKSADGSLTAREESYGQQGVTLVDRFGVWLSKRAIERVLAGRRGLAAVDLGCGYHATLLRSLKPILRSGLGVDLQVSSEAKAVPGLSFVESTIDDTLPGLGDASFDLIMLTSVLEHLWRPDEALRHSRRLLADGGILLINVPTWRGKTFLEFSAFRLGTSPAVEMDDHKMYYDKRDLWPLLVGAGFKPSRIHLKYHKFGLNLFATAKA
jgi:SAM-dependent methyltransferase